MIFTAFFSNSVMQLIPLSQLLVGYLLVINEKTKRTQQIGQIEIVLLKLKPQHSQTGALKMKNWEASYRYGVTKAVSSDYTYLHKILLQIPLYQKGKL